MTSGTVSLLFFLALSSRALAQAPTADSQFNQVLNINGDMDLNSFTFPDRSRIEVFSQTQQQLIVNQNTPPVAANQVTGSTGQPFVALMAQSMSINTNGAVDLVGGQIELQMDPQMLAANAVNMDNTFVGMLSPDRQSWMIMETMRSVNSTDTTVRMVKRNSIDGEYMALGRQTVEVNAALMPFGTDQASSAVIQGTGLQEIEFQDGFRMSVRATQPVSMNVDVKDGVEQGMLAALQGQSTVNEFRYSVTTNLAGVTPDLNRMATVVQLPINAQRIQKMMQAMGVQENGQVALAVAQRGVQQNPGGATGNLAAPGAAPPQRRGRTEFRRQIQGTADQGVTGQTTPQQGTGTTGNNPVATQLLLNPTFTPIQADAVIDPTNMRIAIPVRQVDGEFIITMQNAGGAVQPAAQPEGQQQPQTPTEGQTPAAPSESVSPRPEGQTPPTPEGGATPTNGTAPGAEAQKPEGEAAKPAEGEAKPEGEAPKPAERRQEDAAKPPAGGAFITMKEINRMVEFEQWGGQAPIGKMMTEYVKANNGTK